MTIKQLVERPRVGLARLPTPIEPTSWVWGPNRLLVKRDDLTGLALSGNKVRKLEYLIGRALAENVDTLVTSGGVQSNHARATAIAARRFELEAVLVLTGDTPADLDGNLLLDHLVGADVRLHRAMSLDEREALASRVADELRAGGRRPMLIPCGGSDKTGALGYLRCAVEIAEEWQSAGQRPGAVFLATGSGGTYVGLFLGLRLCGFDVRVIGATVYESPEFWRPRLAAYMQRCIRAWGVSVSFREEEIELIDAVGAGYAVSTPEEMDFHVAFSRRQGLLLDPVYTGKALFALDRAVRNAQLDVGGDVLFIHTGGIFGLFPKRAMLADAVRRADAGSAQR